VLEHNFNWKTLSAVAGLTALNFYFRPYPGAVIAPSGEFPGGVCAADHELPRADPGGVRPPYASELNPVEYIWAYSKHHEFAERLPEGLLATE
jgi:hypothetical protein